MLQRLRSNKFFRCQITRLQTFKTLGKFRSRRTIVTSTPFGYKAHLGPKITPNSSILQVEPCSIELIRDEIFESRFRVPIASKRKNRPTSCVSADVPSIFQHIRELGFLSFIQRLTWAHRVISKCLISPKDSIQLLSVFDDFTALLVPSAKASPTKPSTKERSQRAYGLRIYNYVVYVLGQQNVPLSEDVVCWGIRIAAEARSTAAIQYYLLLATRKGIDVNHDQAYPTFQALKKWAQSERFQGWEGIRQRQQLLFTLTGRESQDIGSWHEPWQKCLHQMNGSGPAGLTYDYLFILQKLCGTQTVFNEWLSLKGSPLWQEFSQVTGEKAKVLKVVVNAFVQVLVDGKDLERAWKVIEDSGIRLSELSTISMNALLDYPESLKRWDDGMNDHLLRRYEEKIRRIEKEMGVYWSGGENGYHTLRANSAAEDDSL